MNRDAINPEIEIGNQIYPRAEIIPATGSFTAYDEWVQLTSLNPGQASGQILLVTSSNQFFLAGSGQPFFVSGRQRYSLQTGAGVFLQRAPRKELFSRSTARDFPNNGAAFNDVYEGTLNIAVPLGSWAFLDPNMVWQTSAFTLTGGLFGFGAPIKDLAGRYYDITYQLAASAGTCFLQTVHSINGVFDGQAISMDRASPRGTARVGDDLSPGIVNGPNYGATNWGSYNAHGSALWTLAVVTSVAATITGYVRVIRRGF